MNKETIEIMIEARDNRKKVIQLLKVAKCPNDKCVGGFVPEEHDYCTEQLACQFCFERDEVILKLSEPPCKYITEGIELCGDCSSSKNNCTCHDKVYVKKFLRGWRRIDV